MTKQAERLTPPDFAAVSAEVMEHHAALLAKWHYAFGDPDNPDWMVSVPHKNVEEMISDMRAISSFLATIFEKEASDG
ncbi:hypothetical protein LVO79_21110 (plasmid) [Roseivivax marinus]|uniref:hypothetical protein n=1 Tax=Roseivivax marinus TaxID=1379903 RepID=UPI001F044069|nr:hypothetical protein [Roseivivax marinus]UMA67281.1 hypothetical protein LVO79_21110 [Roseivivax marinus]